MRALHNRTTPMRITMPVRWWTPVIIPAIVGHGGIRQDHD